MHIFTLTIFGLFIGISSLCQQHISISKDADFIAATSTEVSGKQELVVYSTRYNCAIVRIPLRPLSELEIDSIKISSNGVLCMAYTSEGKFVYNVRDGNLIKIVSRENHVALGHSANNFIVTANKYIEVFNSYGQKVREHKMGTDKNINGVNVFSNDDNFVLQSNQKQWHFYSRRKTSPLRRNFANNFAYNPKDEKLITINQVGKNVTIAYFTLPTLKKVYTLSSSKFLKTYNKLNSGQPLTILPKETNISPNCHYVSIEAKNRSDDMSLLIFDTEKSEIMRQININTKRTEDINYHWVNDSILAIQDSPSTFNLIHVPSGRNTNHLNLQLQLSDTDPNIKEKKQIKDRQLSPDLRYTVVPFKKDIYISTNAIKQQRSIIKNASFTQFSRNGKLIIVKRNKTLGYVFSEAVEYDIGAADLEVNWLSDSCHFDPEKILGEAETPIGYKYPRLERVKHISSRADSIDLNIILQNTTFLEEETEIEFQLLDNYGVHYTGASEEAYRHLWCNLILQPNGYKPEQLKSFQITEINNSQPKSLALSLVLDYSGSMGADRIHMLENGLKRFLDKKKVTDAVTIVKYDDNVEQQGVISTDVERLFSNLDLKMYDEFGGATALLGGIQTGIESVRYKTEFDDRIVIVVTDGNENSSLISKNKLIANAIEEGVKVFTIAFGDYISASYLKSISYNSNGNFYHIYKSADLSWVYEDIYNKINNYYKIRFKTLKAGRYKMMLKLCLEHNLGDTLAINFNNNKVDLTQINMLSDEGFEIPYETFNIDTLKENSFSNMPDIKDFSGIKTFKDTKIYISEIKKDTALSEEEIAFSELNLPYFEFVFDKTKITNNPDDEIRQVLDFLNRYPNISLEIIGHTDNVGNKAYNQQLSAERAEKVKAVLVKFGAEPSRLYTSGKGAEDAIDTNDTDAGRQNNRRVVFELIE